MKKITREEWAKKHKDYKSVINGQKYVLTWVENEGTSLVPVEIIKEGKK